MSVTREDVVAAAARIAPWVRRTPVLTSRSVNERSGREVFFKAELFQTTGSFKYRGATNAVQLLSATATGVVTHSSGNHGQALAKAAQVRGLPCTVVMPTTASAVKKAAVRGYGASIVECGPSLPEREAAVADIRTTTGAVLIPPFDHEDVIAGQGTAALELIDEVPDLDALIVPIGGGGLIAGWALAAPHQRIIGAEPDGASDAAQSLAAGDRIRLAKTSSMADGLLANYLGERTWPIIQRRVERIATVREDEIRTAMRFVWERMKLVIEPSAAVGVAALFQGVDAQRIGIVLCGGNVQLDSLYW
jgi:threonine dehydratase